VVRCERTVYEARLPTDAPFRNTQAEEVAVFLGSWICLGLLKLCMLHLSTLQPPRVCPEELQRPMSIWLAYCTSSGRKVLLPSGIVNTHFAEGAEAQVKRQDTL
jgi:hypothetical protein